MTTTRELLDTVDPAPTPTPRGRRALAALGLKMLDLAAERSAGSIPYFSSFEHTRFARGRLGPGPLLAPELACVIESDRDRGLHRAREYAELYLGRSNYTNALVRNGGFGEEDIADGGSDALIDAVVPQGSAEQMPRWLPPTSRPAPTTSSSRRSPVPASLVRRGPSWRGH